MSDTQSSAGVRANLRNRDAWVRVFVVVVFSFILAVAFCVVWAVVVLQVGWSLIAGAANANLCRFGAQLGEFVRRVLEFVTYHSDFKPFPFASWSASTNGAPCSPGSDDSRRDAD